MGYNTFGRNIFLNKQRKSDYSFLLILVLGFLALQPGHALAAEDNSLDPWERAVLAYPIDPLLQRIIRHPRDSKAIEEFTKGQWKVIATRGFQVLAKDGPKQVLGKTGKIVLSGRTPTVGEFVWDRKECGSAKPIAELEQWGKYEMAPTGYSQVSWGGIEPGMEYKSLQTWNGKPLSRSQMLAAAPLFPDGENKWLLLGFQWHCTGEKDERNKVLILEPTRGGMLVQYYVDGWILYERVQPKQNIQAPQK